MATDRLNAIIGQDVNLGSSFKVAGVPTDPYSVNLVEIVNAAKTTVLQTITPANIRHPAVGTYYVTASSTVLTTSATYYDRWAYVPTAGAAQRVFYQDFFVRALVSAPVSTLTTTRIRLFMRDKNADDNYLLDDVEFSNAEIEAAQEAVIDLWNETPPHVRTFTTANFPYRQMQLEGMKSQLFSIAAANYHRNNLAYSAAGVSVNDKNKGLIYENMAEKWYKIFFQRMQHKKRNLNQSTAWCTLFGR